LSFATMQAVESFLKTLTDWEFIQNPAFADPNP